MPRASARSADSFKTVSFVQLHGLMHRVKGLQIAGSVAKILRSVEACG